MKSHLPRALALCLLLSLALCESASAQNPSMQAAPERSAADRRAAQPNVERTEAANKEPGFFYELFRRAYNDPVAPHLALGLLLFFLILLLSIALNHWGKSRAKNWLAELKLDDPVHDMSLLLDEDFTAEERRLVAQLVEVRGRARHHLNILTEFYGWYFMAIITFALTGFVAAVAIIMIGRAGWSNIADTRIFTVFFVTAGAAALFKSYIGIFRYEENISGNKALYLSYSALEDEIISYTVTEQNMNGNNVRPDKFIHYIDKQLATHNNIVMGFDYTKVPDFLSTLKEQMSDLRDKTDVRGKGVQPAENGTAKEHIGAGDKQLSPKFRKEVSKQVSLETLKEPSKKSAPAKTP